MIYGNIPESVAYEAGDFWIAVYEPIEPDPQEPDEDEEDDDDIEDDEIPF